MSLHILSLLPNCRTSGVRSNDLMKRMELKPVKLETNPNFPKLTDRMFHELSHSKLTDPICFPNGCEPHRGLPWGPLNFRLPSDPPENKICSAKVMEEETG